MIWASEVSWRAQQRRDVCYYEAKLLWWPYSTFRLCVSQGLSEGACIVRTPLYLVLGQDGVFFS